MGNLESRARIARRKAIARRRALEKSHAEVQEKAKESHAEEGKVEEAETESSSLADYQNALEQGRVSVAYARAMLLGVGGAGKSSFLRGLMNLPLLSFREVDSTQVADISTLYPGGGAARETQSHIAKGEQVAGDGDYLTPVTDADEMNEIVGLVRLVYNVSSRQITSSRVSEVLELGIQTAASLLSSKKNAAASSNISAVKKIISEVIKLVKSHPEIQASESEVFLYVWDCGGQPVFLSVLQAFLTSKTMFMLMFNAQHDLDERCLTVAHHHGKATKESQEVSTKELLLQWMACIDATLAGNSSSAEIPKYPRIVPIGTHGDDPDVKSCKDAILDNLFAEYKDKSCAHLIPEKGFIVDNTTAGKGSQADPVYRQILSRIHKFASSDAMKIDTPITWVLFRRVIKLLAQRSSYPCFTMEEVIEVAQACLIPRSSVPSVLKFYHDLAVFLHYSNIPSLESTVIADPHWLVRQMAKLLALKGFEEVQMPALWDILRHRGILVEALYTEIWKDTKLSPQAIVDILEHFLIISSVSTCGKVHTYEGKEYFVPSVLPSQPSKERYRPDTSTVMKAAPLHITFPNVRYLPPGFFTRLATLLSRENGYNIAFHKGIYRNRVSYILGQSGAEIDLLTISECKYSVEIYIERHKPRKTGNPFFAIVCCDVIKTVKKCCNDVCQWLPCITTGLGFRCDMCATNLLEHFVVLESNFTTESTVHCERDQLYDWKPEHKYWLKAQECPETSCSLSNAEVVAIGREVLDKVEELKDVLEMRDQQSQDPVVLVRRWMKEMERGDLPPRPYMVLHLMSMEAQEMAEMIKNGEIMDDSLTNVTTSATQQIQVNYGQTVSLPGGQGFTALPGLTPQLSCPPHEQQQPLSAHQASRPEEMIDNSPLSISDSGEVVDAVEDLAADWRRLAVKLRLKNAAMDAIERNRQGDTYRCLIDAIDEWLKMNYEWQKHGRPSWKQLVNAVSNLDQALAERISNDHRKFIKLTL